MKWSDTNENFKIGDIVEIIDPGEQFNTLYQVIFAEDELHKHINICKFRSKLWSKGQLGKVLGFADHRGGVIFLESTEGTYTTFSPDGIKKVKDCNDSHNCKKDLPEGYKITPDGWVTNPNNWKPGNWLI